MSPRRYNMTKKMLSTAANRQRILEATISLHGKKGIFGTSWKDIAEAADVSIGTVYKHFPSINELVPACGELLMERIQPPSPESVDEIIGEATDRVERLLRVARVLFAFYDRGGPHLESDLRERELPAMREWEEYLRALVAGFVATALADLKPDSEMVASISFLFDFPTFNAMRIRGINTDSAAMIATSMATSWLEGREPKQRDDAPVTENLQQIQGDAHFDRRT